MWVAGEVGAQIDEFAYIGGFGQRVALLRAVECRGDNRAVVLDLSTVTCQQFIEGDKDQITMVLTWLDGWYKGDEDEAIATS